MYTKYRNLAILNKDETPRQNIRKLNNMVHSIEVNEISMNFQLTNILGFDTIANVTTKQGKQP